MRAAKQAIDYAEKRKQAIDRATHLREQRTLGVADEECTFAPARISKPKGHDLGHPGVYDQYGKDAFYGKHPDAEAPRRFAGASDGRVRRLDVDQRGTGNGSSLDALSSEMHRHGGAGAAPRSFPGCTGRSGCGCSACASSASAFQTSLPSSSSSSSSSNAARKANRNTNVGSRPSWDDGSAAEPATRDASYYAAMRGELTHGHASFDDADAARGAPRAAGDEYASANPPRQAPAYRAPPPPAAALSPAAATGLSLLKSKIRSRGRRSRSSPLDPAHTIAEGRGEKPRAFGGAPSMARPQRRRRPSQNRSQIQDQNQNQNQNQSRHQSEGAQFNNNDFNRRSGEGRGSGENMGEGGQVQTRSKQPRAHVEWLDGAAPRDGGTGHRENLGGHGGHGGRPLDSIENTNGSYGGDGGNTHGSYGGGNDASVGSFGDDSGAPAADAAPRMPCTHCGRKFNEEVLRKHVRVCQKAKKRKPFDMTKSRLAAAAASQGVEVSAAAAASAGVRQKRGGGGAGGRKRGGGGNNAASGSKIRAAKPAWKARSEALRNAMRRGRGAGATGEDGAFDNEPAEPDPSMVQCPHCQRTFNSTAAERHIPQCNDIKARPKRLMRGGGSLLGQASRSREVKGRR